MLALGGFLTCAAVLALAALALIFRRPNPPRWTSYSWVEDLVAIAIVSVLAMGIGYLGAGVIGAREQGPDPLDVGLLVAVLVISFMLWRRLDFSARARLLEAETDATARERPPQAVDPTGAGRPAAQGPGAVAPPDPRPPKPTSRAA